jgi:hypothetical protein
MWGDSVDDEGDDPWDITDVFWPFVHTLATASRDDMYEATFSCRAYVTMCAAARSGRPLALRFGEDEPTQVFPDINALLVAASVARTASNQQQQHLAACMSRIEMWVDANSLALGLQASTL